MIFPWDDQAWRQVLERCRQGPAAVLLRGPRGVGKRALALAAARALLCTEASGVAPACGHCAACRMSAADSHPDLRRVRPEAEAEAEDKDGEEAAEGAARQRAPSPWIRIEQIRALGEFMHLHAHRGGLRVALVEPAERLYPNAADSLLKTLEEPPAEARFLLVSDQPGRLKPTILSRCVQVRMALPPREQALDWLRGQGLAQPELALDQAGQAPLAALELARDDGWERRRVLLAALARPQPDVCGIAETFAQDGIAPLLAQLWRWSYDLYSLRLGGPVRYNPDQLQPLRALADNLPMQAFSDFLRELASTQRSAEHPLNPRLAAEQILLRYAAALVPAGAPHAR